MKIIIMARTIAKKGVKYAEKLQAIVNADESRAVIDADGFPDKKVLGVIIHEE